MESVGNEVTLDHFQVSKLGGWEKGSVTLQMLWIAKENQFTEQSLNVYVLYLIRLNVQDG